MEHNTALACKRLTMSHKTLGKLISWTFPAVSAVCLLGAAVLLFAQPTAGNLLLVTTASAGLSVTTWLATDDDDPEDEDLDEE
jgi:hypothetical protein